MHKHDVNLQLSGNGQFMPPTKFIYTLVIRLGFNLKSQTF